MAASAWICVSRSAAAASPVCAAYAIRPRSQDRVVAHAVDLVEPDETERLAVHAGGGEAADCDDAQCAAPVFSDDLVGVDHDLTREDRVRLDQLLGQRQVIERLFLVIRHDIDIVVEPILGVPGQQSVEGGEAEVGRLPVLFRPAEQRHAVTESAVGFEREQDPLQYLASVGLDRVQQRAAVEPVQMPEEPQG